MKHTLRCHGFGDVGQVALSDLALGMLGAHSRGPKPCQPKGVAARITASFVALSTILAHNARAFHHVRRSKR